VAAAAAEVHAQLLLKELVEMVAAEMLAREQEMLQTD